MVVLSVAERQKASDRTRCIVAERDAMRVCAATLTPCAANARSLTVFPAFLVANLAREAQAEDVDGGGGWAYLVDGGALPFFRDRGQSFAWWEVPPLAAIAAVSVYVPYSRVADGRHHASDVLVGAGVGSAAALGFYLYQQNRFRAAPSKRESRLYTVVPTASGVTIGGRF